MLTQNTEVEIKDFTTVPVRCLTCDKSLTTVGWAVIHVWSHLSFLVHTGGLLGIQLKQNGKNVS